MALNSIDETYSSTIFNSLIGMEVQLDDDPLSYGPKRLQGKTALCRRHLDACNRIYLQVSNDLHQYGRTLRQMKVEFDLRLQDMLTNDVDVRAGRSLKDREAHATVKLREYREDIAKMESSISDLESLMTVIKAKRDDLRDTQNRLRDQLKLCQEELNLGARWGSRPGEGPVPNITASRPRDASVEALYTASDITVEDGEDELDALTRRMTGEALTTEVAPPVRGDTVSVSPVEPVSLSDSRQLNVSTQENAPEETSVTPNDSEFDSFLNSFDTTPAPEKPKQTVMDTSFSDFDLDSLLS